MLHSRVLSTCESCKSRKVRCLRKQPDLACINCQKRNVECVFRPSRRKFRDIESPPVARVSTTEEPRVEVDAGPPHCMNLPQQQDGPARTLYIDHLLATRQASGRTQNVATVFKAHENYIASSSINFFSESRIQALSRLLGHNKVGQLVDNLSNIVSTRLGDIGRNEEDRIIWNKATSYPHVTTEQAGCYIAAYFQQIHPLYPFLDRMEFERRAYDPGLSTDLSAHIAWSALYHTVLALGCQYHDGGSFDPQTGEAWKFFQVAMGMFSDIIVQNTTLLAVQVVTCMSIFALNMSCMQIDGKLVSEAARMAQRIQLHKASSSPDQDIRSRTFWVIYHIEKTVTFAHGSNSLLLDCDIGCPIPLFPDSMIGDCDFFIVTIGFARLFSKAYEELFSITATTNSPATHLASISQIEQQIEAQRQTITIRFRPGERLRGKRIAWSRNCETLAALRIHFYYHQLQISLSRLKLHLITDRNSAEYLSATQTLMDSARAVVELTEYIEIDSYTPVFILALMPLSALFILFDFAVHNPRHPETKTNLVLLEAAAGYFSRLEYATAGSLPSSLLVEFAYIARSFVSEVSGQDSTSRLPSSSIEASDIAENSQFSFQSVDQLFFEPLRFPVDSIADIGNLPEGFDIMNLFESTLPSVD